MGIASFLLFNTCLTVTHAAHLPPRAKRAPYEASVKKIAQRNHVDSDLVRAVITAESSYNPHAKSKAGAVGLMKVMPSTARRFGIHHV
jgi:soluble lytic murein transglycosylase-like protein